MNTLNREIRMPLLSYVHAAALAALVSGLWLRQREMDPPAFTVLFMALVVFVLAPVLFGGLTHVLGNLCVRFGAYVQVSILQDEFAGWVVRTATFVGFLLRSAVIMGCVHLTYRFAFPDWLV